GTIGQQYEKGMMGRDTIGMNWYMDQNIVSHTYGSYATATMSTNTATFTGSLTTGWAQTSTITISAATANAVLNAGDTIQIAGVYAVNPQNRQPYGGNVLRNFVVTSAVTITSGGSASVTVSPAIITAGQFQNVSVLTTSASAVVTPFNKTGVVSPQNMVFHRNAFTLATADLELPDGVHFAGRASDKDNGLSIRVVRQYTINNDSIPTRLDVLYGWAPLYPELACRVAA
ncbi:MAG: P22 phage major capsid protein family protein, partial [Burkholderiaceae bacterium]